MRRVRTPATVAMVIVAATLAATLGACGGDREATTKAAWQKKHGALFGAFEKDLDAADDTISKGEKQATISACTQLSDDAKEMRDEAFPVPNAAVDGPLRQSVDLAVKAADDCIQGGRSANGARQVEAAMGELTDARKSFDDAKAAMDAWK